MHYQELHQRYGSHIAKRIQTELNFSEFNQVEVDELATYLEIRAEAAHKEYHVHLDNPFSKRELTSGHTNIIDLLHRRWRDAEEIAYLLTVAEDVSTNTRLELLAG